MSVRYMPNQQFNGNIKARRYHSFGWQAHDLKGF
jgi:hypothetical protein